MPRTRFHQSQIPLYLNTEEAIKNRQVFNFSLQYQHMGAALKLSSMILNLLAELHLDITIYIYMNMFVVLALI